MNSFTVFDENNHPLASAPTLSEGIKLAQQHFVLAIKHQLGLDGSITAEVRNRTKPSFTVRDQDGEILAKYPNYSLDLGSEID